LCDGLLDIQTIADRQFPATAPAKIQIRNEFKLGSSSATQSRPGKARPTAGPDAGIVQSSAQAAFACLIQNHESAEWVTAGKWRNA
jgi:hypothetical protein